MRAEHLVATVRKNLDVLRRPDAPTRAAALTAAASIAARRIACGDPDLGQMPDDLLSLVDYVVAHHDVPGDVWREDLLDGIVIRDWLDHDRDRQRYRLWEGLRTTHRGVRGLSFSQLAVVLDVPGQAKSTAESRFKRLQAVVELGIRNEKAIRRERRGEAEHRTTAAGYLQEAEQVAAELIKGRAHLPHDVHYDLDLLKAAAAPPQPRLVGLVWQLLHELATDHPGYPRNNAGLARLCRQAHEHLDPARRRRTDPDG